MQRSQEHNDRRQAGHRFRGPGGGAEGGAEGGAVTAWVLANDPFSFSGFRPRGGGAVQAGGLSSLSIISSPTSISSSLVSREVTGMSPRAPYLHALGSGVQDERGGVGFQGQRAGPGSAWRQRDI